MLKEWLLNVFWRRFTQSNETFYRHTSKVGLKSFPSTNQVEVGHGKEGPLSRLVCGLWYLADVKRMAIERFLA